MDKLVEEGFIVLGSPVGDVRDVHLIIDADDETAIRERLALDNWSQMSILEIKDINPLTILLKAQSEIFITNFNLY